jgi:hypothetical protein
MYSPPTAKAFGHGAPSATRGLPYGIDPGNDLAEQAHYADTRLRAGLTAWTAPCHADTAAEDEPTDHGQSAGTRRFAILTSPAADRDEPQHARTGSPMIGRRLVAGLYRVAPGDTLWAIARRTLGDARLARHLRFQRRPPPTRRTRPDRPPAHPSRVATATTTHRHTSPSHHRSPDRPAQHPHARTTACGTPTHAGNDHTRHVARITPINLSADPRRRPARYRLAHSGHRRRRRRGRGRPCTPSRADTTSGILTTPPASAMERGRCVIR